MKLALMLMVLLAACGGPVTGDDAPVGVPADTVSFRSSETTRTSAMTSTVPAAAESNAPEPPPARVDLEATGPDDGQESALVRFEANWLCDAQRHVYNSPSQVDEALETSLSASGIFRSEYDAFKVMSGTDEAVRKEILALFVEVCS